MSPDDYARILGYCDDVRQWLQSARAEMAIGDPTAALEFIFYAFEALDNAEDEYDEYRKAS